MASSWFVQEFELDQDGRVMAVGFKVWRYTTQHDAMAGAYARANELYRNHQQFMQPGQNSYDDLEVTDSMHYQVHSICSIHTIDVYAKQEVIGGTLVARHHESFA